MVHDLTKELLTARCAERYEVVTRVRIIVTQHAYTASCSGASGFAVGITHRSPIFQPNDMRIRLCQCTRNSYIAGNCRPAPRRSESCGLRQTNFTCRSHAIQSMSVRKFRIGPKHRWSTQTRTTRPADRGAGLLRVYVCTETGIRHPPKGPFRYNRDDNHFHHQQYAALRDFMGDTDTAAGDILG